MPKFAAALVLVALMAVEPAPAQDYPTKPLRIMIGFAAGGSADLVSRLLGDRLSQRLGQPVIAENRIGASGVIANEAVVRAAPDGHVLVLLPAAHPIAAGLMPKLPYDSFKDFAFVSMVVGYPFTVAVAADSPIKSFPDLLAKAKAQPGKLTYSISGPASVHQLLGELINVEAGTDMVGVPFKGASQAIVDLLGGRIDAMVETATFTFPQTRGGKLRLLAVSSAQRYPLMPEIPTIAETLPSVQVMSWLALATTGGTPRPIVDRLNREVRAILAEPDMGKRLAELGGVAIPSTPEEMRDRIEREMIAWKRIATLRKIEIK